MFSFNGRFYTMADELSELMQALRKRERQANYKRLERGAFTMTSAFANMAVATSNAATAIGELARAFPTWGIENTEK